jgi:hypothetical protein
MLIKAFPRAGVELYHTGTKRFETTSTGISMTGNVGIGTASPVGKLTIAADADNLVFANAAGTTKWIQYLDGNDFRLYDGADRLTLKNGGNVGIGTTNPQNKLDVNGTVRAKEFKATLDNWSDYVFGKNYKLMPLQEVEYYISTNNRLPGIPSASQVKTDGVDLGAMNALLLKKVEELTLYVIELNKKIEKLESEGNKTK